MPFGNSAQGRSSAEPGCGSEPCERRDARWGRNRVVSAESGVG